MTNRADLAALRALKSIFFFCIFIEAALIFITILLGITALADYTPPPQSLARALDPAQVAAIIDAAPADATVSAPAALLRPVGTNAVNAAIVAALRAAIADTRTNIAETASLSDLQIAALYLAQMQRDISPLIGHTPTNTIEYLIGAGMRLDLQSP